MTAPRYRLDDLVRARSVAVVGASQDPTRIGGRPIAFLRQAGFTGAIYPVNAKYAEVQWLRAYPDLGAIPGPVEVAIVSVPARDVPGVVEACARKGVRAAVVFSSGFGEVGEEGRTQQVALERLARATGVRIVGPNCQGVVALHHRLNLSFGTIVMVGLGGLFVEHFADVAFGPAPVARAQGHAMLRSLRAWPLLTGARGRAPADVDAIADALVALSHLAVAGQAFIHEIDVNPLIALATGAVAVDGLIVTDAPLTEARPTGGGLSRT